MRKHNVESKQRISTSSNKQEFCSDLGTGLTPSGTGDFGEEREVNADNFGFEHDSYSLVIIKPS